MCDLGFRAHPEVIECDVGALMYNVQGTAKEQQRQGGHHRAVAQEGATCLHLRSVRLL